MTQHKRLMWLHLPAERFCLRRHVSAACLSFLSNLSDVNVPVRTRRKSNRLQNLTGSVLLDKQEPAVTHLHVNQTQIEFVLLRDKKQTHGDVSVLQDVSGPPAVCRSPLAARSPARAPDGPGQPVELQLQPGGPRIDLQHRPVQNCLVIENTKCSLFLMSLDQSGPVRSFKTNAERFNECMKTF